MTRTDIAQELRRYCGRGLIRASEVSGFVGDSNVTRVKRKYLHDLEAIDGKMYLVTEVAERLKATCRKGKDND